MELIITEKMPTICLNMIVKNESHIIEKTLEMLCSGINFSYWVISDTGSTDNTCEIITNFFKKKNIPGELYNDEWKDFSHNRNLALNYAFGKSDLLFFFDADDEIHGTVNIPKSMDYDGYHFNFGHAGGISYQRLLLVNNKMRWKYVGVLHEVLVCVEPNPRLATIEGHYYVVSGRSGSRNKDPDKYMKDAIILENAYHEAKKNNDNIYCRYAFYCANSYKDAGKPEEAIKWYKITLGHDTWVQEKYVSCLYIYNEYIKLQDKEPGFYYLIESFKYDTERFECLFLLVQHYCVNNLSNVAYQLYEIVRDYYENRYLTQLLETKGSLNGKLFVDQAVGNFFLPFFMILVADRVKESKPEAKKTLYKMFEIVFTIKHVINDKQFIGNILFNVQFFIDLCISFNSNFVSLFQSYIDFLVERNIDLTNYDFMKKYEKYGIKINQSKLEQINKRIFSEEECKRSNKLLIYTGYAPYLWNYTYSLNNALGGSETAVCMLAKCLSSNFDVYVCGTLNEETFDNVHYINMDTLKKLTTTDAFNTVIVSRYVSFYELFQSLSYHKSYIWGHDTVLINYGCDIDTNRILSKWSNRINGCVCQTEWHKKLFLEHYPELTNKISVINNGISVEKFLNKNVKISNRFVYTSCAERGLDRIVELWPEILKELPDAELHVCSYNDFPKNDSEKILHGEMMKYNSIKHLGKLNKQQLYDLMSSAEYWLYPTGWPETSCITAMEMLMSEVICIYYPLAGLNDTLGNYGIRTKKDSEIEDIINLSIKKKNEIKRKGKEYAITCSWENRSSLWKELFGFNNKRKIAIFNGFPFHYEMFGFILNYAKNNNIFVDIYTNQEDKLGWLSFYSTIFNNFILLRIDDLNDTKSKDYEYIYLTTDDDIHFNHCSYDNVVIINHHYKIRNNKGKYYLNCGPFKNSDIDFCYPVYPIFNSSDKINNINNNVITIIGGNEIVYSNLCKYNIDIINRFHFSNNLPITINFICRDLNMSHVLGIQDRFNICIYSDLETNKMFEILKTTSYIYITYSNSSDKNIGLSCSGCIQLLFNTLCKGIVSKTTNQQLKIKNCVEYDTDSNDPIYLDNVNFDIIKEERDMYINKFENIVTSFRNHKTHTIIPKQIIQTWEHKNIDSDFQKIIDSWKYNNSNYDYVLYDRNEREKFIIKHFDSNVIKAYKSIISGAYKADLFRYCYLYINGGVYIDIDTLCLNSIDKIIPDGAEMVVPIDLNSTPSEGQHNLSNGFIACKPKHPVMLKCIEKIVFNVENNIIPKSKLDFCGPGLLGRCVNIYLGNNEEESFIGKKQDKNIHFLIFEKNTEYIKNLQNEILFQNKNGNEMIRTLYDKEYYKIKNNISWLSSFPSAVIGKNIALTIYGEFRSFEKNLIKNIEELQPILDFNNVYVFILSEKNNKSNYSIENENKIREIFNNKNMNICFINYIEDVVSSDESIVHNKYFENIKYKKDDYQNFIPNLIYRKFLLNKLKNEYIKKHNINIDLTIYCRLFDMIISKNNSNEFIKNEIAKAYYDKNIIFGSSDSFFIGSEEGLNHIFSLSEKIGCGELYHDDIWNNTDFRELYLRSDSCLGYLRHTYAPEVQYVAHAFFSNYRYFNIRVDYNNIGSSNNNLMWYNIIHDPDRFTSSNI